MFFNKKRILLLCAHPDDEILGTGGLLLKAKQEKTPVFVYYITNGCVRFDKNDDEYFKKKKDRINELYNVLSELSINEFSFFNIPSLSINQENIFHITSEIKKIIKEFKPNILFTHHKNDIHLEHNLTHQISEIINRPNINNPIKYHYSYEVVGSSNFSKNYTFIPNTFLDIENYIEEKTNLYKKYTSVLNEKTSISSTLTESLYTLASYRGLQSGLKYAEAYNLEKQIIY